jgi:type IV pilus assembly protein PilO
MNKLVDKFNSVSTATRVFVLILLMVVLVAGFFFAVLQPLQDSIASQEQQLVQLQREKERLEQLKRNRAIVLSQLEKLKAQLLIAQEKLPQDAEIPSLLQRIHNQAKTAGLDIMKFRRLPDRPQQYYIEIPVEMELNGTYDELANFLYYVGRMTRIVNVKNLDMVRVGKGMAPDGELSIKAQGTTFRYSKPGAATADPKKGKK